MHPYSLRTTHLSGWLSAAIAADAWDKIRWVFKQRPGVKFHGGSALNADAVVWNMRKVLDKATAHFDPSPAHRCRRSAR